MGRGRNGLIEQSEKKPKVVRSERERAGTQMTYFYVPNRDGKKNHFYLKKLLKL